MKLLSISSILLDPLLPSKLPSIKINILLEWKFYSFCFRKLLIESIFKKEKAVEVYRRLICHII